MNFIDKLKNVFGKNKINENEGSKITPTGYEAYGLGSFFESSNKTKEYLDELKGWVGAATTAIADDVASIQLHLYRQKGDDIEEVTEHPVLDLLFKINSFTSKFDHFWLTQTYLELTGEAPWFIDKKGKEIKNIFLLRPDKIKPIAGKSRMIEGYEYEIGLGETVKLDNDEVIFLKNPNPAKPFRGIGTLQMAAKIVDIDNFSEDWNKQFYQNSARPDAILTVDTDKLNDEQKDKLKKSLKESYEGTRNAHKTMVLFGNMTFEKSSFSAKDMDFLEQQRFSRDKILGIFRVPKAIVAQTEGVNFASAKAAQYIFAKWTIKPKMERLIQQLNEFLLPLFSDTENMFLDYDSPVPEDDELKLKKYESGLRNNYLTINEVRNEEGLPEVEGGDVIYVSGSIRPLGEPEQPSEKPEEGKTLKLKKGAIYKSKFSSDRLYEMKARGRKFFQRRKETEALKDKIRASLKEELEKGKVKDNKHKHKLITKEINNDGNVRRELSAEEIFNFWTVKNKIFDKYQKKVEEDLVKVFNTQRKIVLGKLGKKKDVHFKASSDLYNTIKLNKKKEVERTLVLTLPTLTALFKEAGDETFDMMDLTMSMDMEREEIKKLLKEKGRLFAVNVTDTTNDFIKKQVVDGIAKGDSIPKIKKRIVGVFDSATEFRAERIARTESLKYSTRATEQAFKDSGIVEGKMWVTDPDPCPLCQELAGRTAPLGGNFVKKGGSVLGNVFDYEDIPTPPLHPNSYHKDTEILTKDGWKQVSDLKCKDKCLSLNPKNFNLEYVSVINTIAHKEDRLISFQSNNFSLMTTGNHSMFYQTDWNAKNNKKKWNFVESKSLLGKKAGRFYRSSNWIGKEYKKIKLGNKLVSFNTYCKFMGWYLSEGSVSRNHVNIAQSKEKNFEKWCSIKELLNDINFKIYENKNQFEINDKKLAEQLKVFGKSFEKYVPENIKNADSKYIRCFLDTFIAGDGNIRESRKWGGFNWQPEKTYFTSSQKLADDLGELILKIGKRPSYYLQKSKGIEVEHKNGKYIGNHDIWIIRECKSQYAYVANMDIQEVKYDDMVYCVELEKYHTLYVRYNGKVTWSGNCKCDIAPVFKSKKSN